MCCAAQGFASRDSLLQTAMPVPAAAQMQMAQQMQAAGNAQQPVLYAKAVPVPGQTAGARLLSLNATSPLAENANAQAHARTARAFALSLPLALRHEQLRAEHREREHLTMRIHANTVR